MTKEEKIHIERLLDVSEGTSLQKAALKWISEYLEEGYILNLRPSREILSALLAFGQSAKGDAALKRRAANLHKKYRPKRSL